MSWVAVSFYTPDNLYRGHAQELAKTLINFGIEHDIEQVPPKDKWESNCAMKPEFIRKMLGKHSGKDIVWIDADARVKRRPELFDSLDCDVAVHFLRDRELLSGTIFLKNNERARELVDVWVAIQRAKQDMWDQKTLWIAITQAHPRVFRLPPQYTQIFDTMSKHGDPVIEHLQASRVVRRGAGRTAAVARQRLRAGLGKLESLGRRIGYGVNNFEEGFPNAKNASALKGTLLNHPCVILGNSSSLNRTDMSKIRPFKTIGCNRILRLFDPDYYIVVDRDPYRQDISMIRRFPGVRVLSSTIYNEKTSCHRVPVQPIPEFPFYYFRALTTSGWPLNGKIGYLPVIQADWSLAVPSAANISFPMFQLAVMLGCNPIGIAGVDLEWRSVGDSHFFGNGAKQGCFPFSPPKILAFFHEAARWCARNNVKVFNLSPEGVLDAFERISADEFHRRFAGDIGRPRIRDWKLVEPGPSRYGGTMRSHNVHRHQPPAALVHAKVLTDIRQGRAGKRDGASSYHERRAAALKHLKAAGRSVSRKQRGLPVGRASASGSVQGQAGTAPQGVPVLGEQRDLRGGGGGSDGGDRSQDGGD
jgi:hypothetical protein